ncbi:major facilitator superfamily domain-containing protein [Hyaloraphidium curvatum]|nr:major facilitator superfamily domain-containing protein [Hyaloraphidium curvatum]
MAAESTATGAEDLPPRTDAELRPAVEDDGSQSAASHGESEASSSPVTLIASSADPAATTDRPPALLATPTARPGALANLPSNFGSSFSYAKNEGHEERDGFGNTFKAGSVAVETAPATEEQAAPKGFFAKFRDYLMLGPTVVNEPDYTKTVKQFILIIVSVTGILGPLTGSIYSPALKNVQQDFNTSSEMVNATLTAGIIALGVAPLIWAPLSDRSGRRFILLFSQCFNIAGSIICIFSPNIYVFLVGRILASAGSGAGLSVGAGVIADVFKREERGRAFGLFYLGPLIGPVIAPLIGGSITSSIGWHHIFSVSAGLGACVLLSTFFFLPETLPWRRRHIRSKEPSSEPAGAVVTVDGAPAQPAPTAPPARNPLKAFVNLKYPFFRAPVAVAVSTFGAFYALPSLVPLTWPTLYGYNPQQIGLFLMSSGFGFIAGSLLGGYEADRIFKKWKDIRGGLVIAEDRLRSTPPGLVAVPLGLLLYGWPVQAHMNAAVPTVGMFILGFGSMILSTSTQSFMLDCFTTSSAAVVAITNFCRFMAAGIVPLVALPIANAIGQGWFFTILAGINIAAFMLLIRLCVFGTPTRATYEPWSKSLEVLRGAEIVLMGHEKAKQQVWWRRIFGLADLRLSPEELEVAEQRARDKLAGGPLVGATGSAETRKDSVVVADASPKPEGTDAVAMESADVKTVVEVK